MTDPVAPQAGAPREVGGRDLPVAIAVGVVLAALFLGSLFAGALALTIVISLLIVLAVYEAAIEFDKVGIQVEPWTTTAASLSTIWLAYHLGFEGQVAGMAITFGLAVAVQMIDRHRTDVLRRLAVTVFLGIWIGLLASYAVLLRQQVDGEVVTLAVIGAAIFADIGGFAVGVNFGRTKIAPAISPNKSLEGLIGGLVLAAVVAAVVLPQVGDRFTVGASIAVALLAGVGGFLGDLAESMVKRDVGIKDFGHLIPGHGGALDRVDGILLALPLGFYALALFG